MRTRTPITSLFPKRYRAAIGLLISLIALLYASVSSAGPQREHAIVLRVIDGDTLLLRIATTSTEKVRLIGVDTLESKHNKRAQFQAEKSAVDVKTITKLGKLAFENTRQLAPIGSSLELEYDRTKRDKYGRLLAYAYLPDGTMLNERILVTGFANLLTVPPNVKYAERFKRAYQESRSAARGLWAK